MSASDRQMLLAAIDRRWPRGLTVCQPYAHLIAVGDKSIENRVCMTTYRGPVLIHAGLSKAWLEPGDHARYPGLVFGAVVAIGELVDCVPLSRLPARLLGHQHANGPCCWLLERVCRLTSPVVVGGARGLWVPDDSVVRDVRQQLLAGAEVRA